MTHARAAPTATATSIGTAIVDNGVSASGSTLSLFTFGEGSHIEQSHLQNGGTWQLYDLTDASVAPAL